MKTYVILLRGINVGGNNKVPMAELKKCLEDLGFSDVLTYIASGNVLLKSDKQPAEVRSLVEDVLPRAFKLDKTVKALILTINQLQAIVDNKPNGFGEDAKKYYDDVIFLMDIDTTAAMAVFDPREGVDRVWAGDGVIYSQRLGELRVKSRLNKIVGTLPYKSMTIRTWNTTTKLLELMKKLDD